MKEKTWKKAVVCLVQKVAEREANVGCTFWSYQRKQPDVVRKLRKF